MSAMSGAMAPIQTSRVAAGYVLSMEGHRSAHAGAELSSNPYGLETGESALWVLGWVEGKAEMNAALPH